MRHIARLPLLVPLLLTSCNRYDLFQFTGFAQESFSSKADILFVIDNSDSMQEETESLATSFAAFVADLAQESSDFPTEDLADAVRIYAAFAEERGDWVNYQLGVTTTDVGAGRGQLYGSGAISRLGADPGRDFARNLLCEATCFAESPPAGNTTCGDPLGDAVTSSWLECECEGSWRENCGSAVEEPIEAVFMAMCRSVENPPAACFDPINDFTEADVLSSAGFLRPGATFIPVIVTDEGDSSRRVEGNEPLPDPYPGLFNQFGRRMVWAVVGPDREEGGAVPCRTGASDWGTLRLQHMVQASNGLHVSVADPAADCAPRDFRDALGQLGDLLANLNRSFRLAALPVEGTLSVVTSDGGFVDEAEYIGDSDAGVPRFSDGWSYDFATNTVLLHGSAVPGFGEGVTVYYKPQDGNPRELPF